MTYLWIVTAKRNAGKLPAGASVEIVKQNTSARPTAKEIVSAFENKYGIAVSTGHANSGYFDFKKK